MKRDQIEPPPEKTTFKKPSLIKVKHLIFIFYGNHDNRWGIWYKAYTVQEKHSKLKKL